MARTCVDRGGTYTDVVVLDDGGVPRIRKVPSDVAVVGDLAEGSLTFGTTVATNALLERKGVPTLLVVTAGFRDLARIGDMTRPALFDPDETWPAPLACRTVEVEGRLTPDGTELEPLVIPADLDLDGVEAVAVALLHSPRDPSHERAVAEALLARRPDLYVALGHELSPEVGYLARIETALVDAAITPVLRRALARDRIPPDALALRSDGSLCPAAELRAPDAVLSGPAGGVVAVAAVARQAGVLRAVGLDMGGTSTDVCIVGPITSAAGAGDLPRREGEVRVAGVRLRRPMLEVETIAAGGGSILWDDGLRLGVGPASAGADPGPACRGRGGPPTVTDAALLAGLLDPEAFDPPLDAGRARVPGDPEAFLELARDQMAGAIRRLAAGRGLDIRDHALVAFGGAAGQHAARVAERLGIGRVLIHPAASVLCAWGQLLARREEAAVRPLWQPLDGGWAAVGAAIDGLREELEGRADRGRRDAGGHDRTVSPTDALEERATVELRHVGTDHAIEVPAGSEREARAAFAAAHRARYGFDRDLPLEVVNVRLRRLGPVPQPPPIADDPWGLGDREAVGPVRLDCPTTSIDVPAGWRATRAHGLLVLDCVAPAPPALPTERTPHATALWASRFQVVASQAGAALERTARSVNIRDRLDFSCAVFDGAGNLVANAPHVPVHLGAMGETVRDLLRTTADLRAGQHWLCNDPGAGGSHLPDLTVVTPVEWDGERLFVGCRAHHVDVGGTTPGSMPPRSVRIEEEGFVVRHLPLLDGTRLRADLREHLVGCRQPDTVTADLEAQIASNTTAARLLRELGPAVLVARWAAHLQDVADESVARLLARLPRQARAVDRIDGIPLAVALACDGERLVVDFAGTGGPHPGNLNAPTAVVRAAVLYALRVLAAHPIPLNEGALRRVDLRVPSPSILAPPAGVAVAGGNVETSQRLVDLVLRAAGFMAASGGSMSNLTLGGPGWSLYETIGAGQGASARGPGPSGRQLHMTNTRATDPEVLERRLPLRIRRFMLREGSGGDGVHRGGDGLVREVEVLGETTAALLASRRDEGAPGLGAGAAGRPGEDEARVDGKWIPWNGSPIRLNAGDRVRVGTPGGGGYTPGD